MSAIRLNDYWSVKVFLGSTPSNTVANKITIKDHNRKSLIARGFIGIERLQAQSIFGGICWGSGDPGAGGDLHEVIFELAVAPRKTKIVLISSSVTLKQGDADRIIESFFPVITSKVQAKMISHLKGKKGRGKYKGRRMEGHKRGKPIKSGDFFDTELDNLFTADFIKYARKLSITYR